MASAPSAAGSGIESDTRLRRSFIWRKLDDLGARFQPLNGGTVAMDFGDEAEEMELIGKLGLIDLSPLPRSGFKGAGAVEWLQFHGVRVGSESNRGYLQAAGEVALRLAPTEVFLIDSPAGTGELMERLNRTWSWGVERPRKPIGYPMPRADSHAWFALTGHRAPEMFAKICAIDLRLDRFDNGRIAQTSIAKMSGIILRMDRGDLPVFHLLADSASADYLWDCLSDAMAELDGAPVGLAALRAAG